MALALRIVADDLGYSSTRDAGILHAFAASGIHAASLLVNGASAGAALHAAVAAGLPVGLHFNITEGRPLRSVAVGKTPNTLLRDAASDPFFRGKHGLREALHAGAIADADVEAELRAQLAAFVTMHPHGQLPVHVDGHQHVHVLPGIAAVFARVVSEVCPAALVRVPTIEFGRGVGASHGLFTEDFEAAGFPAPQRAFYESVCADARAAACGPFAAAGLVMPDAFCGFTTMGVRMGDASAVLAKKAQLTASASAYASAAGISSPVVVEWMVHPGWRVREGEWKDEAGCGEGPDDFSMAVDREIELTALVGAAAAAGAGAQA